VLKKISNGKNAAGANEEFAPSSAAAESAGPDVAVVESRQTSGRVDQPKDDYSRFFLVVSGSAHWQCGERRYLLGPETLCHVPAGLAFQQDIMPNQDVLAYVLRYKPAVVSPALAQQLAAQGMVRFDLGTATVNQSRSVQSIFREMLFEQESRQDGWEMMLHSRLIDVAVRLLRLTSRKGGKTPAAFAPGSDSADRVARYVAKLKTQFFRQETMNDAARSVGLSCRQFSELFRKATGQSWRQHVLALRLKHATGLLSDTDKSVSAVAFESGFDDLSNFHHIFKIAHGCSPLAYREQHRVKLPTKMAAMTSTSTQGFQFRGMKGWSWTPEQYLEEIPVLAELKMNFLMNCYRSMSVSQPGEPWINEWWRPLTAERKKKFSEIIASCARHGIAFCFALHPQLASPRPLVHGNEADLKAFFQHYAWAQAQGVKWFAVCLDDTSWGKDGPVKCGKNHSALVNEIFERLQAKDNHAKIIFCPASFWGDGTNPEHAAYLNSVASALNPDVFVFWNGDAIVTPRITRVAAQSYKTVIKHRLFLWDNYPVNDGSPTMHLGPLSGREPDLCEVIDGYISNPMCSQNQINRLPLATCADYANDPVAYKPARSIGQTILRFGKTPAEQLVLKELVEAYPGFIVAGGGTGTNPVRAKFGMLLGQDRSQAAAKTFVKQLQELAVRQGKFFPNIFSDARRLLLADLAWMNGQLGCPVR
jgi:AraC-like DNA-binding protein